MSDENNNNEKVRIVGLKSNMQFYKYYKYKNTKWHRIIMILMLLILVISFSVEKSFAKEVDSSKLTIKEKFQNFSINHNKKSNKGEWILLDNEMSKKRCKISSNLLLDGNVLLIGGCRYSDYTNTIDIYNPEKQEIIRTIVLNNKDFLLGQKGHNSILLENGDVYISYFKKTNKPYFESAAKIFDSKSYSFRDIIPTKKQSVEAKFIPLKNGNILIFPNLEIYNPKENKYYTVKNETKKHYRSYSDKYFQFENGNILFFSLPDYMCLYVLDENKLISGNELPHEQGYMQLDSENYLSVRPEEYYSRGYVYNVKTKEKIYVKNKIDRTWRPNLYLPVLIPLDNGNVLILGVFAKKQGSDKDYRLFKKYDKYKSYIYDKKQNYFYEIENPPVLIDKHTSFVRLNNGDILFAGGGQEKNSMKLQIFRYKQNKEI